MADAEKRARVLILTEQYRILGEVRLTAEGGLWDLAHRAAERVLTVHDAQFFALADGKRAYDAGAVELNRDAVVALFREEDLGFMRKIQ